ncbi:esterase-like activity of phytase family protein [Streptomyces endophyticus]|uniref:Esterase-like activity of phytase family protein n=1 Tax=Streptomyces endophyticus TaxID=714166 RepID=A0ABU6F378_9ACTN|nr:esterase-like activity of phytase family protein [Streptomyces endophyticus]MEB8337351.1 esterase-like activity of phytase family protein [Streptomyces endophyticus]
MSRRSVRSVRSVLALAAVSAACLTVSGPASAAPPAAGNCSPSVSVTGYSDALDKTTYDGTFVGNISALATDRGGRLAALSDRSSLFTLDGRTLAPRSVAPLADEKGAPLDSEGLVVDRDGTYLVTSETEPSIRRYDRSGARVLDRLPVPARLQDRARANASFEGLTLLPGGRTLLASMEAPLTGDEVNRLQTWRRTPTGSFAPAAQYGYRADTNLGISEVTAAPDGRLLVLERGFTSGVGNTVRLYAAELRGAEDTSGMETIGSGVRLAHKRLLADLADCPSLGAPSHQPQPNPLLDNIEAMTVTGRGPHGALRLLLASDDNQSANQITRFYSLRIVTAG